MNYKTLLLGTAAVFVMAGGARAADLAVAESVEYVKVCDAYGAGYFYIPGTDSCLNIGGYVLMDTYFYNASKSLNYNIPLVPLSAVAVVPPGAGTTVLGAPTTDYLAAWKFYTEIEVNFTDKWMTDWGMGVVHIAIRSQRDTASFVGSNFGSNGSPLAYLDTAYFKIGGLEVGWDASPFDVGDQGVFSGLQGYVTAFDHDQHQQQLTWSTTMGGVGFFLSVLDPRDDVGGSGFYTGHLPDFAAEVSGSAGSFKWWWSAGYADTIYGAGYGTMASAKWSFGKGGIEGGNFVGLSAAVGNAAGAAFGANYNPNSAGGTPWHVAGQVGLAVTAMDELLLGGAYRADGSKNEWEASIENDMALAKNVEAAVAVEYDSPNSGGSSTTVDLRIKATIP